MSSKAKKLGKSICKDQTLKATKDISNNLVMMGHCKCSAPIFSYIDTEDKRSRFDIYCMGCGYVSDIRFPRHEDEFFMKHPHSPLEMLITAYKERGINITDEEIANEPQSEYVGTYRKGEDEQGK